MFERTADEIAYLVAEDTDKMRRLMRVVPAALRSPTFIQDAPELIKCLLPITNVVGPVHFAAKHEEPHLQLADACAYSFRRYADDLYGGEQLLGAMGVSQPSALVFNPRVTKSGQMGFWPPMDPVSWRMVRSSASMASNPHPPAPS